MSKESLAFRCPACKQVAEKVQPDHNGFEIAGMEDMMDWSDFTSEVSLPEPDVEIWGRSLTAPEVGERKIVQVYHPFHMSIGEELWTLFQPALSGFNGWDEHPDEIDMSAAIKCRFERILSHHEQKAWIMIAIQNVIFLKDLTERFPQRLGSGYLQALRMFGKPYMTTYDDWILLEANSQGNIGVWALLNKTKPANSLVAYGEWEFHSNRVYFGNFEIPSDELSEIIDLALSDESGS